MKPIFSRTLLLGLCALLLFASALKAEVSLSSPQGLSDKDAQPKAELEAQANANQDRSLSQAAKMIEVDDSPLDLFSLLQNFDSPTDLPASSRGFSVSVNQEVKSKTGADGKPHVQGFVSKLQTETRPDGTTVVKRFRKNLGEGAKRQLSTKPQSEEDTRALLRRLLGSGSRVSDLVRELSPPRKQVVQMLKPAPKKVEAAISMPELLNFQPSPFPFYQPDGLPSNSPSANDDEEQLQGASPLLALLQRKSLRPKRRFRRGGAIGRGRGEGRGGVRPPAAAGRGSLDGMAQFASLFAPPSNLVAQPKTKTMRRKRRGGVKPIMVGDDFLAGGKGKSGQQGMDLLASMFGGADGPGLEMLSGLKDAKSQKPSDGFAENLVNMILPKQNQNVNKKVVEDEQEEESDPKKDMSDFFDKFLAKREESDQQDQEKQQQKDPQEAGLDLDSLFDSKSDGPRLFRNKIQGPLHPGVKDLLEELMGGSEDDISQPTNKTSEPDADPLQDILGMFGGAGIEIPQIKQLKKDDKNEDGLEDLLASLLGNKDEPKLDSQPKQNPKPINSYYETRKRSLPKIGAATVVPLMNDGYNFGSFARRSRAPIRFPSIGHAKKAVFEPTPFSLASLFENQPVKVSPLIVNSSSPSVVFGPTGIEHIRRAALRHHKRRRQAKRAAIQEMKRSGDLGANSAQGIEQLLQGLLGNVQPII